jgi:hypothetical protein
LGRVERDILKHMAQDARKPYARDVVGGHRRRLCSLAHVTGHHPESVRRALKSLERKGYVTLGWDNGYGYDGSKWLSAGPTAQLSVEYYSTLKSDDVAEGSPSGEPVADLMAILTGQQVDL